MAKMKTTGTLAERVARMTHTLNINLRNAQARNYADFAEYKFIERQLTHAGFITKSGYAVEAKPAALAKRFTEDELKAYERTLTSALQKAEFLKGRKGAREFEERANIFKKRIESTTGAKIDKTKVYDLVKLQSAGIWRKLEQNGFSSAQIVNLVQEKGAQVVADKFNEITDFYDYTGMPFNKNDTQKFILGEIDMAEVVRRNIKRYGIENIPPETLKQYGINAEVYKNL